MPLAAAPIVPATCVPWPLSSQPTGSTQPRELARPVDLGHVGREVAGQLPVEVRRDVGVAGVDAGVEDADPDLLPGWTVRARSRARPSSDPTAWRRAGPMLVWDPSAPCSRAAGAAVLAAAARVGRSGSCPSTTTRARGKPPMVRTRAAAGDGVGDLPTAARRSSSPCAPDGEEKRPDCSSSPCGALESSAAFDGPALRVATAAAPRRRARCTRCGPCRSGARGLGWRRPLALTGAGRHCGETRLRRWPWCRSRKLRDRTDVPLRGEG